MLTFWSSSSHRHRAGASSKSWLSASSNSCKKRVSICPLRCGRNWSRLSQSASRRVCRRTWWSRSTASSLSTRQRALTPPKATRKASESGLVRTRLRLSRTCHTAWFNFSSWIRLRTHLIPPTKSSVSAIVSECLRLCRRHTSSASRSTCNSTTASSCRESTKWLAYSCSEASSLKSIDRLLQSWPWSSTPISLPRTANLTTIHLPCSRKFPSTTSHMNK